MLDATKNTHIMENVVPKLVSYMTMKNILRIQNQKAEDKVKEEEKAKRKAVLLAETGISFDESHEEPEHTEDKKDGKKGKKVKVEEIDPEVLEQRRQAALKAADIAKYGVSYNKSSKLTLANMDLGRLSPRQWIKQKDLDGWSWSNQQNQSLGSWRRWGFHNSR